MHFENMEAIRLGAVKYEIASKKVTSFDSYIKPVNRSPLTSFCKNLTRIKDSDLAHANEFSIVFSEFLTWIGGIKKSRFFSWSKSDLARLKIDSHKHHVPERTISKIEKRYVDFQSVFTKRVSKNPVSVESGLELYGLSFIGNKHNPMYDSYNTLRIYVSFLNEPIQSDLIMLQRYIFKDELLSTSHLNRKIQIEFKKDITILCSELKDIYKMKDVEKTTKKIKRIAYKYENILINRSGLFSEDIMSLVESFIRFYHEFLLSYQEHQQYLSKIMILGDHMITPLKHLQTRNG